MYSVAPDNIFNSVTVAVKLTKETGNTSAMNTSINGLLLLYQDENHTGGDAIPVAYYKFPKSYQSNNNYLSIETLFIRNGIVFGRSHNIINNVMDIEDAFIEYIVKFYESNVIPKEIIVPEYINTELWSNYL
mgnify:CR=1 FL=1